MAAPAPTVRGTPDGILLRDGFSTLITCAANTTVSFWEKEVTPPGFDGGDMVDQTTMHNETYRTKAPRSLIDLTESSLTAAYDPNVLTHIVALINVETTWTVTFPDGSTWAFFGVLRQATPQAVSEGTQPEIQITIEPTNTDAANSWVEAGPAVASVAGT